MDEWLDFCDDVLSEFILKRKNRAEVAKALFTYAKEDAEEARYLLFEIFAEYLTHPKVNDIFSKIKNKELSWKHPGFDDIKRKYQEFDDFITSPPEVEEGVIECKKCGSKKTFSFSKQTRSADEATTVFVRCANCNSAFRL